MREYAKPSILGERLGYPPDGKRFGRVLSEVGLRDTTGQPSKEARDRGIAVKKLSRWQYDIDAVAIRVMGGFCPPDIAREAESIGSELIAIDASFTSHTEGAELAALGERWDHAMRRITPRHVPRLNGVLRREAAPFRIGQDGEVELLQTKEKNAVA